MAISDCIRTCRFCGNDFVRRAKGEHVAYCGPACFRKQASRRDRIAAGARRVTCSVAECSGLQKARGLCSKHYGRVRRHGSVAPIKICNKCGVEFPAVNGGQGPKAYCSPACSKAEKRAAVALYSSKRRLACAGGDQIDPNDIFDRDMWTCQMCRVSTPSWLRGECVPAAPELDHVIPLSRGGVHEEWNLQCLCRKCNISKGAKSMCELNANG